MRSNRFAVLKNVRVYVFEDILKNGRNDLISVSLVPCIFICAALCLHIVNVRGKFAVCKFLQGKPIM